MAADEIGEDGFSEHRLSAGDGLRLYFRLYGERKQAPFTVLCLPGLSRNSKDFHDLALSLSQRFPVICPDYRGVGRSAYARHWRAYSPQICIDDIKHILSATNRHHVVIAGTSFGGILAAGLTVAAPSAVSGVILNDVGPETSPQVLDNVMNHIGRSRRFAGWDEAIAYMKRSFPNLPTGSEERWQRITRNTFREEGSVLVNDWDPAIVKWFPGVLKESKSLWPLFRSLARRPVLAIRGEYSEILSAATFERMARDLPGLERITVPGVGHAPDLAEPSLQSRIEAFLDTV